MKYSTILVGTLVSIASAHSGGADAGPVPQMLGGRQFLSDVLGARRAGHKAAIPVPEKRHQVEERQDANGQCGVDYGKVKCKTGCCSPEGYCGTGIDYCSSPDCQLAYGPDCDGNKSPAGTSTASIARPKLGSIEYGGDGIYDCQVAGEIALTFDDGPYLYTSDLLDKLKAYNAKATFMITGNNLGKGPIDTTAPYPDLIRRMIAEGHQIASHTWSHQNLSSLDATTFQNQIVYNEMAFRNILGYFPTYMRPPYSDCNTNCENKLKTLGYHITYFDLDTAGYIYNTAATIQTSKDIWDAAINPSNPATDNFLQIEHDIQYQTVYNLTDYILASLFAHGYKSVRLGDCLGDPEKNWYRAAGSAIPTGSVPTGSAPAPTGTTTSAAPTSTGKTVSTEGNCGTGITCQGSTYGNCCSQHGYCGASTDYCGTGCQSAFGLCGSAATSGTQTSPSQPTSTGQTVSDDGSCSSSVTCNGSSWGNCCSQFGYCGSTAGYCGTGCKPGSGTCT